MEDGKASMEVDFHLAAELAPRHDAVVRGLGLSSSGEVLSGSRDRMVSRWSVPSADGDDESKDYGQVGVVGDHPHWVNCIIECRSRGGFITGCQDGNVRWYDASGSLAATGKAHSMAVNSLGWTSSGQLLSGSWDGSARVWDLSAAGSPPALTPAQELPDHENACCVLGLPNGTIVTGSSGRQVGHEHVDFKLRLWRDGQVVKTMEDHMGPIKDLRIVPGVGFLSASNDGTCRLWDQEGNALVTIGEAHGLADEGAGIVSAAVLPSGEYVMAGDDGVLSIWEGSACVQRVQHPRALCTVLALPNGDVVTGGEDYAVRVFSRSTGRAAPPAVVEKFEAEVLASAKAAAASAASQGGGGGSSGGSEDMVDPSTVTPASEMHLHPGTKDGEIRMFLRGGAVWAYHWEASEAKWKELGRVGNVKQDPNVASDGKRYDEVLPIELDPGNGTIQHLKIGFNRGDNPYSVAQRFVAEQGLDPAHRDRIAEHIVRTGRAGGVGGMGGGGGPVWDGTGLPPPGWTGAISDGGGSSSAPGGTSQGWCGVGVPPTTTAPATASAIAPAAAAPSAATRAAPVYLMFEKAKVPAIMGKLVEFQETLSKEAHAAALSPAQLAGVHALANTLADRSSYHASKVTADQLEALGAALTGWPVDRVFPAIDLFRVAMVHPAAARLMAAPNPSGGGGVAVEPFAAAILVHLSCPAAGMPVLLCAARTLANMFAAKSLRAAVVRLMAGGGADAGPGAAANAAACSLVARILASLQTSQEGAAAAGHNNKNVAQATATLLLTLAGTLTEAAHGWAGGAGAPAGAEQALCARLLAALATEERLRQDATIVSRALGGLAILAQDPAHGGPNRAVILRVGVDLDQLLAPAAGLNAVDQDRARELQARLGSK